ncbi:hypothetical protein L596_002787 [Steinernema carpocapsae]|uniref:Uncharacterized protein n=1 Tax=Steinernema carpocapsae TaxID=34508 RepID=A0A4U8UQJ1_STECR|nr:hypothetical protein L596_002787 [Steinernema carpocapsae]
MFLTQISEATVRNFTFRTTSESERLPATFVTAMSALHAYIFFAFVTLATACDVNVTFISMTAKPVFFQMKSFDGSLSQLYHFDKFQQEQKLRLKGKDCGMHTTEVATYEDKDGEKGPLIHNTVSLLEGNGSATYWVTEDKWARMVARMGLLCAIECGGRG